VAEGPAYELQLCWNINFEQAHVSQLRNILVESFKRDEDLTRHEQAIAMAQAVGAQSFQLHLLMEEERREAILKSKPIINQPFGDVSAKLISPGVKVRRRG
jgi:hypothetical protein